VNEFVSYQFADGVATIVIDDGKVNALSTAMLTALNGALDRAAADGAVVILTGRPGIFSGGFDLATLRAGGGDAALMLEQGFQLALRLLEHPSPVVIACNGHAVAMGLFLLLSGDYLIGAEGPYRLVANEVAIGLTLPLVAIELCRHRVTPSHFIRVVGLAEAFSPSGAVAAGFLDLVVEPGDLSGRAHATAAGLARLDRSAHAATKRLARADVVKSVRAALAIDLPSFHNLAVATEGSAGF
jgi:enoyl-CoA hydratase